MIDDKGILSPVLVIEKLITLDSKVTAAHSRIDKMELLIHEDLTELKGDLKEMSKELKDVIAWMNRGKGWSAAILVLAGILGGAISTLAGLFIKH